MAKKFAWSYSRLKNFETCPRKHEEVDVKKRFADGGEQLEWGNKVHEAMAKAITKGEKLPVPMRDYELWAKAAFAIAGQLHVEKRYAITDTFEPTEWFAPNAWFRCVVDYLRLQEHKAVVLDWKTGKVLDDPVQLFLCAATIMAHFPEVEEVTTMFAWLKASAEEGELIRSKEVFTRADLANGWEGVMERVQLLADAYRTGKFIPKPSGLCRFCPVTTCEYNKRKS